MLFEYSKTEVVYRKIKSDSKITVSDFLSHIEKIELGFKSFKKVDKNDISYYSCSFFTDVNKLRTIMNLPPYTKKIIQGELIQNYGPMLHNKATMHIDCWIYDNVDLSVLFSVREEE